MLSTDTAELIQDLDYLLDSQHKHIALSVPFALKAFYIHSPKLVWFDKKQIKNSAYAWLNIIKQSHYYGLNLNGYHNKQLHEILNENVQSLSDKQIIYVDILLTDSFFSFTDHLRHGQLKPNTNLRRSQKSLIGSNKLHQSLRDMLLQNAGRTVFQMFLSRLEPQHKQYKKLRETQFNRLKHIDAYRTVDTSSKNYLKIGIKNPRVASLRQLLFDIYPEIRSKPSVITDYFDEELQEIVKIFQTNHQLINDGIVGPKTQIILNKKFDSLTYLINNNLERWRWLPDDLGNNHVWINIPEYMLYMVKDGQVFDSMKVIVGQNDKRTPVMSRVINYLVFNPYWFIPSSIALEEFVPKMILDSDYFQKQRIHVYIQNKQERFEINPKVINWHGITNKKHLAPFKLIQDPWPGNSLGRIKFILPNDEQIYLHDTPQKELMDKPCRSFSSGCVRLEDSVKLANFVLSFNTNWSPEKTAQLLNTKVNQTIHKMVKVDKPIPVHIHYITLTITKNEKFVIGNDPYKWDIQ